MDCIEKKMDSLIADLSKEMKDKLNIYVDKFVMKSVSFENSKEAQDKFYNVYFNKILKYNGKTKRI